MKERFLLYSLRHQRPIKAVWMDEGHITAGNLTVVDLTDHSFQYITARRKKAPAVMAMDDLLSCCYARGDNGENEPKEG